MNNFNLSNKIIQNLNESVNLVEKQESFTSWFEIEDAHTAEYAGKDKAFKACGEITNNDNKSNEEVIVELQELKSSIDERIKTFTDADKIPADLIPNWVEAYKNIIDHTIEKVAKSGKFYVILNVSSFQSGDNDPDDYSFNIVFDDKARLAKQGEAPTYFDTLADAKAKANSISEKTAWELVDAGNMNEFGNTRRGIVIGINVWKTNRDGYSSLCESKNSKMTLEAKLKRTNKVTY